MNRLVWPVIANGAVLLGLGAASYAHDLVVVAALATVFTFMSLVAIVLN